MSASKQGAFLWGTAEPSDGLEWETEGTAHFTKQVSDRIDRLATQPIANWVIINQTPKTVTSEYRINKLNDKGGLVADGRIDSEKDFCYWGSGKKDSVQ